MHARERAVAARLQRQVQVLAHARALGHRRDRLGPQVLRVRRREADALDAVDRVERAQQIGELRAELPGAEVAAVGVDVLAEQRDLDDAVSGELLDLGTMSPMRRLTSRPRTDGTMQNAQELSQPIWIVTQAAWSTSRRAGSADGIRLVLLEDLDDRTVRFGRRASSSGACARLCVPNTTSTHGARSRTPSRSFWARQPPTAICRSGRCALSAFRSPRCP